MKNSGREKRPGLPIKNLGKESKEQKTSCLSETAPADENMLLGTPVSGLMQDSDEALVWFKRFESCLDERF